MTYTQMEAAAIRAFSVGFNYTDAESEVSDNATALSVKEISEAAGINIQQTKGVVGSLTKKGLLTTWDEPGMEYSLHVTEEGIRAHYDLMTGA